MKKKLCLAALISFLLIFNSCLGLSLDITMNKDGSGRIVMEYRISQMLENMGAFDGNESMPAIPLSREDWAKAFERNSGVKLVSFSSKKNNQDAIINVTLDFKDEAALLSLLDPFGEKVSVKQKDGSGALEIILLDDSISFSEDEISLTRMLMEGYNFSISFQALGNSALAITDSKGRALPNPSGAVVVLTGKKVLFSTEMAAIFDFKNGLGLKFTW